jgi:hypothetical protein
MTGVRHGIFYGDREAALLDKLGSSYDLVNLA